MTEEKPSGDLEQSLPAESPNKDKKISKTPLVDNKSISKQTTTALNNLKNEKPPAPSSKREPLKPSSQQSPPVKPSPVGETPKSAQKKPATASPLTALPTKKGLQQTQILKKPPNKQINPFSMEQAPTEPIVPWVLEFRIAQGLGLLQVQVLDVMTIGRGAGAGAPDVDFTPFRALEHGVSRRHAIIMARKKFLTIRDLNSTNGTYINGLRLMPDQDVPLEHGDWLRFGKLESQLLFSLVPPNRLSSTKVEDTGLLKPLHEAKGEHILILEDDHEVSNVYEMMLTDAGYRVTLVDDPTEATAIFVEDQPDAVILDLMLRQADTENHIDGLEVLRLMNNRNKRLDLKTAFIVISAMDQEDIHQQAIKAGAKLFLPKPLRIDELIMRLGVLLHDDKANPDNTASQKKLH